VKLSIIIPTFNERGNIVTLVKEISNALKGVKHEIIFADDSADDTTNLIMEIAQQYQHIKLSHRKGQRGLASAVLHAIPMSKAEYIAIMDADLQHPPSVLPKLLSAIEGGADLSVASRYCTNGSDAGLSGPARRIISKMTRLTAYLVVPSSRSTSDPLSGFFIYRRSRVGSANINPVGFKILLELLAKSEFRRVIDIGFKFDRRTEENSKAGILEAWNYLRLLWRLRSSK
tara:strand:+ start:13227 stop:13916 length:690 start_codon:yes stop_codon:yes gene_type:complete